MTTRSAVTLVPGGALACRAEGESASHSRGLCSQKRAEVFDLTLRRLGLWSDQHSSSHPPTPPTPRLAMRSSVCSVTLAAGLYEQPAQPTPFGYY